MRLSELAVICLAFGMVGCAATGAPTVDGLAPVASRQMDALYVRPDADIRSYHRVFIEPVPVSPYAYTAPGFSYWPFGW